MLRPQQTGRGRLQYRAGSTPASLTGELRQVLLVMARAIRALWVMCTPVPLAKVSPLTKIKVREWENTLSPRKWGKLQSLRAKVVDTGRGENWGQLCNLSRWEVHRVRRAGVTSLFPFLSLSLPLTATSLCCCLCVLGHTFSPVVPRIQTWQDPVKERWHLFFCFFHLRNLKEGLIFLGPCLG